MKKNYRVEIKELHRCYVDVEAENREAAVKQVEEEYWQNPNDYCLEPYDTLFN